MASIKIILKNKANSQGKYPLYLQIIKDRRNTIQATGHYVDKEQWDKKNQRVRKSHTNATTVNNDLKRQVADANKKLIELNIEERELTAKGLKTEISSKSKRASFIQYSEAYLDNLEKSKKFNQHSADKPRVNRFKEFIGGEDIDFKNITVSLLKKFQAYLKDERDISTRTIVNHLVVIRTIFNTAIKDRPALSKYYPFGKGRIQIKFPDTRKVGLTAKELKNLEQLGLEPGSSLEHSRNIWLFAFYFAGMRISDVLTLTWDELRDDRLHYGMNKNDKVGSLKIPEKALAIIAQYKREGASPEDYVFPDLDKADKSDPKDIHRKIKSAVKRINGDLKVIAENAKIDKPLTHHIARHTFGNLSGDKIPPHMLQKLYRHSSLTTTLGYQSNFIYKDADEALDSVLGRYSE